MMRTLADQLDVDKILCGEALAHIKVGSPKCRDNQYVLFTFPGHKHVVVDVMVTLF